MHPRNPYRTPPDFLALAEVYPALRAHVTATENGPALNFQDPVAQRCLTEALLYRDFKLSLIIPEDRLCPPIPNRLNYILWLQDILDWSLLSDSNYEDLPVRGLDVGTGASAIYPLLGCKERAQWHFVATDIDEQSLNYARLNVRQNGLEDRIRLLQVDPSDSILQTVATASSADIPFDFTMCNPPFYGSREEVFRSADAKELGPSAVCTGTDNEMITDGGEAKFVAKMVKESKHLKTRCRWYTSMLGKLASIVDIAALLHEEKIDNFAITEFTQGQTRRWAIAWSFSDIRLPDVLARISNPSIQKWLPPRNTLQQPFPQLQSRAHLKMVLLTILSTITGITIRDPCLQPGERADSQIDLLAYATGNTWSRAARRRKMRGVETDSEENSTRTALLTCRIRCPPGNDTIRDTSSNSGLTLVFDWVKGWDRGLFESFMSHVGRKVEIALKSENATTV